MKTLTLVRHAKSAPASIGQNDFDRPLNEKGLIDATVMAQRIAGRNIPINLFVCSPALRAMQTCKAFCDVYNFDIANIVSVKKLYNAPRIVFYDIVGELNNAIDHIALFAHNPGITQFTNDLVPQFSVDNMPTCGVMSVAINTKTWAKFEAAEKRLLVFDYPKNMQNL